MINLNQILLTKSVVDGAKEFAKRLHKQGLRNSSKPSAGWLKGFLKANPYDDKTFPMGSKIDGLLTKPYDLTGAPAIEVKKAGKAKSGKQMFTLMDGRHRVARALLEGIQTIDAKIV